MKRFGFIFCLFLFVLINSANTDNSSHTQQRSGNRTEIPIESVDEYSPCCAPGDESVALPEASRMLDTIPEHRMPIDDATFRRWKEEARTRKGVPRATTILTEEKSPFFSAPPVSKKFEGTDKQQAFGATVPDTNVAVSETRILEATNGAYRLSTKNNANAVIRHPSHFHKRSTDYLFDPRVHYDRFSKRFIAVASELVSRTHIDIAISRSSDPSDLNDESWCTYRVPSKTPAGTWPDFPIVGMNEKWLVVTTNQFTRNNPTFKKSHIKIIDLAALANNANACPKIKVYAGSDPNFHIFPAQHHTHNASPGHPLYMIAAPFSLVSSQYFLFTVQGSSRPSISKRVVSGAQPYGFPPDALQPGGTPFATQGAMINDAEFRKGSLYFTHNTVCNMGSAPNETCVRVAKLDLSGNSPVFRFQATVGGGHNNFFWFPSIAVNSAENTAMVFQQSGKQRRLGLAHTSKRNQSANFGAYKILKMGECSREIIDEGDRNRSGDYTGVHIDPADDKGVWYAAEYAKKVGSSCQWGTYIVNIKSP